MAGNAAIALGEIRDVRAVTVLVAALKELRKPVLDGGGVLRALQTIGAPAIGALAAAGRDPNPDVRVRALTALGRIADDGAVAPLVAGLHDNEVKVRAAAAGALAWSRNPRVEQSVLAAAKDTADEVRQSPFRASPRIAFT